MSLDVIGMKLSNQDWTKQITFTLHGYQWLQLIANTSVALKHPEYPKMSEVVSKSICKEMTEKLIKKIPSVLNATALIDEWKETFNTINDKGR